MAGRREHVGLLLAVVLVSLLMTSHGLPRPENEDEANEDEVAAYDEALKRSVPTYEYTDSTPIFTLEDEDYEDLDIIPEDAEADEKFSLIFEGFDDEEVVGSSSGNKNTENDNLPASYSAVDDGLVLPPANRGQCKANDAVFASTAAIEACYAKVTGQLVDLSEQLLLDCATVGPKKQTTSSCSRPGLSAHAYLDWVTKKKIKPSAEQDYPYQPNPNTTTRCPATLPPPAAGSAGVRIKPAIYTTSQGTEKKLREMVAEHGVVVTTVWANPAFRKYKSGVFAGCKKDDNAQATNHVVAVVGFGKDAGGKPYWLLKNSRGATWGEKGYMRLLRGKSMCGIGKVMAYLECEPVVECTAGDDDCEDDQAGGGDSGEYETYDESAEDEDEEEEKE